MSGPRKCLRTLNATPPYIYIYIYIYIYGDAPFKSRVLRQDVPPARHSVTTRVVTGVVPGVVTGVVPGVVTDRCYRLLRLT